SVIAIHSTRNGPALGGCRMATYASTERAVQDAIRLAQGMSYKAVMCGLPLGGGKAVIMKPSGAFNRRAIINSFAQFVHDLNGRYITSIDSGTSVEDLNWVAQHTAWVAGHTKGKRAGGDPSPYTARGVLKGMEAAIHYYLPNRRWLDLTVLIQGVGHVGYYLAKYLYERGAKIIVSDVSVTAAQRCAQEFNAQVVDVNQIYRTPCDVFSPCALGGVLTEESVRLLPAKIIAGSANNQLANLAVIDTLKQCNIHYVPDYVLNAGGLIQVYCAHYELPMSEADARIDEIYPRLLELFRQSTSEQKVPAEIVDKVANEKLNRQEVILEPN
ncbi:MAG TPA: amino acid dehydrogenase, partial [Gammaproteobacteria bacterium]|nr:amino acid dehydrogenase [Gammaproteobacteria bacterium]